MKFWILSVSILCLIFPTSLSFDPERHRNWKKLDHEHCGTKAVSDRIIGGKKAALGEFPWIVGLYTGYEYLDRGEQVLHFCGGSLVTSQHVVTAAHCMNAGPLYKYPSPDKDVKYVQAGDINQRSNPDCRYKPCLLPFQMRRVKNRIPHPLYNDDTDVNDIAILKVDKPFYLNAYVNPICLLPKSLIDSDFQNEVAAVAGWGRTETGKKSEVLLKVNVTISNNYQCRVFWMKLREVVNSERQICAGNKGKGSCGGDSGSPLMMKEYLDSGPEKTFMIGVVSYGTKRCGDPAVYTRVSYYEKWILDNLRF